MFQRAVREELPFGDALQAGTTLDQRARNTAQPEIHGKSRAHRTCADDDDLDPAHSDVGRRQLFFGEHALHRRAREHAVQVRPQVRQAALILYFYPERWVNEGNAKAAAEVKAHAEAKIGTLLDQIDAHLASHGKDWFSGERYSALDPYAFLMCRWTRGFSRPARSLPQLGPYLNRMLARPAVQRVIAKEKLAAPYV